MKNWIGSPFEPDVAYMPVPRCDTAECTLEIMTVIINSSALALRFQMRTKAGFGCTQWEAK